MVRSSASGIAELNSAIATVEIGGLFSGKGTQSNPYLITKAEDLETLYTYVAEGNNTSGKYFHMVANITLPSGWKPIGITVDGSNKVTGGNLRAFSGIFDATNEEGGCYTITIPVGGLPLFGHVQNAIIRNLNVYGTQIAGYGLVNELHGVDAVGDVGHRKYYPA